MKREIAYFCPQCQSIDVEIEQKLLLVSPALNGDAAKCGHCGWEGRTNELIGAVSPENEAFWTTERIGKVLLLTAAKHSAGPLIQCLELLGLLPRIEGSPEQQASAQAARDHVMQSILGAAVIATFESAAEVVPAHYKSFPDSSSGAAERIFSFGSEITS